MATDIRIGTQGWNYEAWVGPFYPLGTRVVDFLSVYARAFDTVEVDSTFYAIPAARTVRGWAERTPAHFRFALKMPQEITHEQRLRHVGELMDRFFDAARELGPRLGPVLMQFGPDFGPVELPALAALLPALPRDVQVAVEFRHRDWIHDGVLALLAEHNVALALVDGRWMPRKQALALAQRPTADFAYLRWMGPDRSLIDYSRIQIDRTRELEQWAGALSALSARCAPVWGYVNNHYAGHSPASARKLQSLLGQDAVDPDAMGEQMFLFSASMRARDIGLGLFAVVFASVCIRLGVWQLSRLSERRATNREILARIDAPAVPPLAVPRDTGAARYRRVRLDGIYDFSHELVLANRSRDGAPGVNLLTPLRLDGVDTAVLVDRGWVYSPDADTVRAEVWREPETLHGIGYVLEFTPPEPSERPDVSPTGALHRPELAPAAAKMPYPLAPFFVVLLDDSATSAATAAITPVRVPPPALDDGPHLSYAIQWFTFATIGLVGVGIVLWGKKPETIDQRPETRDQRPETRD